MIIDNVVDRAIQCFDEARHTCLQGLLDTCARLNHDATGHNHDMITPLASDFEQQGICSKLKLAQVGTMLRDTNNVAYGCGAREVHCYPLELTHNDADDAGVRRYLDPIERFKRVRVCERMRVATGAAHTGDDFGDVDQGCTTNDITAVAGIHACMAVNVGDGLAIYIHDEPLWSTPCSMKRSKGKCIGQSDSPCVTALIIHVNARIFTLSMQKTGNRLIARNQLPSIDIFQRRKTVKRNAVRSSF